MFNKRINLTQKNLLLCLYILILGLFGPVMYFLNNNEGRILSQGQVNEDNIEKRISVGDKILVTANSNPEKQAGVKAFASKEYVTALRKFDAALKSDRNDPETLIYRNNTSAARTKDIYKIAVSVPIGGNLNVAKEILRGVAQAQNEINQSGGVNSRLVMVEIANDDNDPEIAKKVAAKFVEDSKVLAVIGHNESNASIAAAPFYQQGGLVMITPTSSADTLREMGSYIFRATPSTRALAETLANYTVDVAGKANIAVCIDSQAEVSKSFKEEFTWATYNHGGKIAPTECDLSAPDFLATEIPSRAISDGADALVLAPSILKVDQAIEVAKANDDRLTLLGSHSMSTYTTLKEGQVKVNGMVSVVAWDSQVEPNNSFNVNANKLWGGAVNWRTAMAYDAAKTALTGIKLGASREQLQQTMTNPAFVAEGATSVVRFLPSGDRNLKGILVEVQPGKKSGTGYDFVPFKP
jgi:branched-chain amino acid transport system substrate-binding protein